MWVIKLLFTVTAVSATSNMIFKKIDVQVGAVGSDDDIRIKICDRAKCCTTKELSHTFGSEWKKNKLETWDGRKLGNCSDILFDDKLSSVEVSIVKELSKKDPLEVTSIALSAQVGSDKKNIQMFKCRSYSFRATDSVKSNTCLNEKTAPKSAPVTTRKPAAVPTKRPVASSSSSGLPTLLVKKIIVQVGAVGTDDDVTMKICDLQKCCVTKELSHTLSSEWVKNKLETWDGRKLGNCSSILFQSGASSLEVAVLKTIRKKQPLEITSIVLETSPSTDKKKVEKFKCGAYKFVGTDTQKTNFCLNENAAKTQKPPQTRTTVRPITSLADLENYKVNNVVVQMGDDGTNDAVSLEICSSKSALNCCDTGTLSSTLSDDWSRNDKETWKNKDLGPCKTKSWDACRGFDVAVKKKSGKDSLKVNTITLDLADKKDPKQTQKFVCTNYNIGATDTVKRSTCTLDKTSRLNCPKVTPKVPSARTTKRPTPPPRKASLPAGKPPLAEGTENVILQGFEVQVGRDGTKDSVTAKVCSAEQKVCCETPALSQRTGNNWVRNGNATWDGTTLGSCRDKVFPTKGRTTITNLLETKLILTLNKSGRDTVKLDNFNLDAVTAVGSTKRRFKCGKLQVLDTNTATKECYAQFPKKIPTTPRTGPCLRSGKNCDKTTTTRPPFRSGSG